MDTDTIQDCIDSIQSLTTFLIFYGEPIISQEDAANVAKIIKEKIEVIKQEMNL